MAHDVFISYSSQDQQAALAVLHGLESHGIRCWMAPRDIRPGAIWAQAIMDGIAESRVLVVVFSSSANRSSHVLAEVDAAVRKGVVIVPFRIEDVLPDGAMEYHLRARHWLDALTPDLKAHVTRLAEQVDGLLVGERQAPADDTLPKRSMDPSLRTVRRRAKWRRVLSTMTAHPRLLGATLLLVALGGWWQMRPRRLGDISFTVREVSSGGGNESTFRVVARRLRFFEGPSTIPPLPIREYGARFAADEARHINVELELAYDPPGREVRFPFACVLEREGAQVVNTLALTATVQPSWNLSYHANGWAGTQGAAWEPGRYRVECRYGDRLIARDWFTVAEGGFEPPDDAPVARTGTLGGVAARIAAIRLFESGYGTTDPAERAFTHTFPAETTRYVNLEVTLAYDPPTEPLRAELTCRYLRNRTEEIGRLRMEFELPSGSRRRWSATGWGRNSPGYWQPGEYLVACDDGETTLGQVGFTIAN